MTLPAALVPTEERRCVRIKRDGEQCGNWAMKGTTICHKHGGTAPQIQGRIARDKIQGQALAYASRMVAEKDEDFNPAQTLVDGAVASRALFKYWLGMCAALDLISEDEGAARGVLDYAVPTDELDVLSVSTKERLLNLNRHGEAQIHPFVTEMNGALDRLAKFAKLCLDARIDERRIALKERDAQEMVKRIRAFILDAERTWGYEMMSRPEFPAMIRRHLLGPA